MRPQNSLARTPDAKLRARAVELKRFPFCDAVALDAVAGPNLYRSCIAKGDAHFQQVRTLSRLSRSRRKLAGPPRQPFQNTGTSP